MHKRNIFTRFKTYFQKHGFMQTYRRICEHPRRMFNRQEVLFYADMNDLGDTAPNIPHNVTIESKSTFEESVQPDMQRLVNYWNEQHLTERIKERFELGAILWIVRLDGNICGFIWSIRGKFVAPYYLPLTPHDAAFIDSVFFEEFRGKGLFPILINYVLWQLKISGVHRTFSHAYTWNKSSIHGMEKTYLRRFSQARKFSVFGRNVVAYSEVQKDY